MLGVALSVSARNLHVRERVEYEKGSWEGYVFRDTVTLEADHVLSVNARYVCVMVVMLACVLHCAVLGLVVLCWGCVCVCFCFFGLVCFVLFCFLFLACMDSLAVVSFAVIDKTQNFFEGAVGNSGIWGLGFKSGHNTPVPLFDRLVESGQVTTDAFSMVLCGSNGHLWLGDLPASTNYYGQLRYVPILPTPAGFLHYSIKMSDIEVQLLVIGVCIYLCLCSCACVLVCMHLSLLTNVFKTD